MNSTARTLLLNCAPQASVNPTKLYHTLNYDPPSPPKNDAFLMVLSTATPRCILLLPFTPPFKEAAKQSFCTRHYNRTYTLNK